MSDMANHPASAKKASLYRMMMPHHTCPYGLKAKYLLKRSGYEVEDHHLTTREETETFKAKHDVRAATRSPSFCASTLMISSVIPSAK